MYCGNCGHQMNDKDRFCTNCGFDNNSSKKKEDNEEELIEVKPEDDNKQINSTNYQNTNIQEPTPTIGILAIVFSLVFSPIGLILGIIAISKGNEVKANKTLGIVSTIISILSILLTILAFVVVIAAYNERVRQYNKYDDKIKDYIEKSDTSSEEEKKMQGKWTCTLGTGESMTITFKKNNEFEAEHDSDEIEGSYYAYKDYTVDNKSNIYLYYDDEDEGRTSTKGNFIRQNENKAILTIENQVFNCLK